jgi:flagellar hook-length control protein FliK
VNSKNATDHSDDNAADAAATAEAAALSSALFMPGMYVPTLQAPTTPATATATTTAMAALTSASEQSDAAPATADTNGTFTLVTTDATNSLTPSAAAPLVGSIWASGVQAGAPTAEGADNTSGATAALSAAQATPLHVPTIHSQAAADTAPPAQLRAPVGSAAWTDQLGAQLTWMARHGQESGSLHVSPEHLGPVEVRIEMRDGTASVWFGAAHADTRSALEQSLPRLRDLFATSGLSLGDAGVARDAPRQNAKPVTPSNATNSAGNASVTISKASVALSRSGLIDTYV